MPHAAPHVSEVAARDMAERFNRPDFRAWARRAHTTGGCAQPIHLRGSVDHIDPMTGAVLHRYSTAREPGGVLRVACKTRRASRCPACAEIYRADTYQLVRAGLVGGKGVPDTVTDHPQLLVTLTAPSFGRVHSHSTNAAGQARRCGCGATHSPYDSRLGAPLDPESYDWVGSVLWQAHAPELWRRFTIALQRRLAARVGLSVTAFRRRCRVAYSKVVEFQARGLVHVHAPIRLDGQEGPDGDQCGW